LQKLDEIKVFWDGLGSLDENWRIDNPNAQPTESSIWSLCGIRRMYIDSIGGIDEEKYRRVFENIESHTFTEDNNNLYIVEMQFNGNWENVWGDTDDDGNRTPTRFATKKEAEDELAECFQGMRESNMVFDEGDYRISKVDDCGLAAVEDDDDQDGPSMC